jgi:NifB/MoaA-like Fe-S oxidoreductase
MQAERIVTLVTSTMAEPVIDNLAADLRKIPNLKVRVLPVVNKFFGPEVTVAGLLCARDVLDTLHALDDLGDLILLPRVMLDNAGERFLDDITVEEFKDELPTRVEFVRNAPETVQAIRSLSEVDTLLKVV